MKTKKIKKAIDDALYKVRCALTEECSRGDFQDITFEIDPYGGIYSNRSNRSIHFGLLTFSQIVEETTYKADYDEVILLAKFVIMHEYLHIIHSGYSEDEINKLAIKHLKRNGLASKEEVRFLKDAFCQ